MDPPRPIDELDRVTAGGLVDLRADTPLHNMPLKGDGDPGFFLAIIHFLALFLPRLRNWERHVTRASIDEIPRGLQVFSTVTNGLPPLYRFSSKVYTQLSPSGRVTQTIRRSMPSSRKSLGFTARSRPTRIA